MAGFLATFRRRQIGSAYGGYAAGAYGGYGGGRFGGGLGTYFTPFDKQDQSASVLALLDPRLKALQAEIDRLRALQAQSAAQGPGRAPGQQQPGQAMPGAPGQINRPVGPPATGGGPGGRRFQFAPYRLPNGQTWQGPPPGTPIDWITDPALHGEENVRAFANAVFLGLDAQGRMIAQLADGSRVVVAPEVFEQSPWGVPPATGGGPQGQTGTPTGDRTPRLSRDPQTGATVVTIGNERYTLPPENGQVVGVTSDGKVIIQRPDGTTQEVDPTKVTGGPVDETVSAPTTATPTTAPLPVVEGQAPRQLVTGAADSPTPGGSVTTGATPADWEYLGASENEALYRTPQGTIQRRPLLGVTMPTPTQQTTPLAGPGALEALPATDPRSPRYVAPTTGTGATAPAAAPPVKATPPTMSLLTQGAPMSVGERTAADRLRAAGKEVTQENLLLALQGKI